MDLSVSGVTDFKSKVKFNHLWNVLMAVIVAVPLHNRNFLLRCQQNVFPVTTYVPIQTSLHLWNLAYIDFFLKYCAKLKLVPTSERGVLTFHKLPVRNCLRNDGLPQTATHEHSSLQTITGCCNGWRLNSAGQTRQLRLFWPPNDLKGQIWKIKNLFPKYHVLQITKLDAMHTGTLEVGI